MEFHFAYVFGNIFLHSRSNSSRFQFFPSYLAVVSYLFMHMSKGSSVAYLNACFLIFRSILRTRSKRLLTRELTTVDYCIVLATLGYYKRRLLSITRYCKTDFPSTLAQWNFHDSIATLDFVRFC